MNDLDFISGIKIHQASGNELLLDYDILNNPFIMTPTFYNMKQVLSAVGLRLSFGSHSTPTTSYNIYSYEDSNIDYSINQFQLYKLNFLMMKKITLLFCLGLIFACERAYDENEFLGNSLNDQFGELKFSTLLSGSALEYNFIQISQYNFNATWSKNAGMN